MLLSSYLLLSCPCPCRRVGARRDAAVHSPGRCSDIIATTSVINRSVTTTDGADVRWLGCRGVGPGAVRLHDVVSHRVSRLLDRACKLSRGARGALAVDRARGLHQPVQLLA